MTGTDRLIGVNAVEAALRSGRRRVERIWVLKGRGRMRIRRLEELARRKGIVVEQVERSRLERLAGREPGLAHQGVVAAVGPPTYRDADELLRCCGSVSRLLVIDGVEDPRNLGALLRVGAGAGVEGVFVPQRRAVGLTATVAKASAGAVERVPVARIGNVASFIKRLKKEEFWTIGMDAAAPVAWDRTRYPARLALVVGGEGRGLRRLVRETCDEVVAIPLAEGVESLNVAVATGICLYEALRQERARGGSGPVQGRGPAAQKISCQPLYLQGDSIYHLRFVKLA